MRNLASRPRLREEGYEGHFVAAAALGLLGKRVEVVDTQDGLLVPAIVVRAGAEAGGTREYALVGRGAPRPWAGRGQPGAPPCSR